ncbi:hypothetical protein TREMEDRAFT_38993 [Tremella mesenterica DSM 1558]|uniref:uncharacterized protein n=1 Tax=Tremella mesenterica (strain ATCC 24925 / CBS 8224 / DSM 1558 / NBRC 9311 / NRRL Y-6157 / RJB 2259-6 / UBC 559-6) TaxID=578456 RepID=UPI0003F496D8|nr:uncharacterized protein TREMEDRAFT_38993 [Tremella mesenterica DSM 1558]EIW69377.1 hypothetical protein TREMEDRAFT_38993 [Tremella mesenterica DSM 1558]
MSAPSGVKVSSDITSAFTAARNDQDVRALVFTIQGESFQLHATLKVKETFNDDIALLPPSLPSSKTPASFAYRLDSKDSGKYEWMMITYVPDDAPIRAKMLQASSRSALIKSLGATNFKHDWHATSIDDLTPNALTAHMKHMAAPPPLSAQEIVMAGVREAEAAEANRAPDPEIEARRRQAVVALGGKIQWGEGVEEALKKCAERSDEGWVVVLEIPQKAQGSIALLKSEACPPSQVGSKLPDKTPSYTFYSYPTPLPPASPVKPAMTSPVPASAAPASPRNTFQATQGGVRIVTASSAEIVNRSDRKDEIEEKVIIKEEEEKEAIQADTKDGRVVFIYTCPTASPVKFRMVYSSSVRGVQQEAIDKAGVQIVAKLETSDTTDITESYLSSSLNSKPSHSSSLPNPAMAGFPFGRPRPMPAQPARSASQIPLPSSGPVTPVTSVAGEEDDGQGGVRKAFDSFGPRVNAASSMGPGFGRPWPVGKKPLA